MLFFWIILYGLVYGAASRWERAPWILPLGMLGFTAAFLWWIRSAGYWKEIGMRPGISWGMIPLLVLPLSNGLLNGLSFLGWETALVLVCVSSVEELLFRGFLFQRLLRQGKAKAVLGTSVIFSLMHLVNLLSGAAMSYTLIQILCAFVSSLCYCLVILRWKSLYPCIVAHILTNLTASGEASGALWMSIMVLSTFVYVCYSLWLLFILQNQKRRVLHETVH